MPRQIGLEAREAALMLDELMEGLLAEAGLPRVVRNGSTLKSLGLLVQYAIDKRMERFSAERLDA